MSVEEDHLFAEWGDFCEIVWKALSYYPMVDNLLSPILLAQSPLTVRVGARIMIIAPKRPVVVDFWLKDFSGETLGEIAEQVKPAIETGVKQAHQKAAAFYKQAESRIVVPGTQVNVGSNGPKLRFKA